MKTILLQGLIIFVCFINACSLKAAEVLEAGEGNYDRFWFASPNNNQSIAFSRYQNYIRVSVVSWYINKQGSWWTDRMASGTCQITIGAETYSVALGTFALEKEAYTAPIFDKIVVDNRLWTGGDLGIKVFLKANQKNTVIATILTDMAQSSLGLASTAAESYGAKATASPYAPLAEAGKSLITSVQNLLKAGPKELPIFDLGGLDLTTSLASLKGDVNYVLLFRGNLNIVKKDKIKILENGMDTRVLLDGKQLTDGAWMLLKISNEISYGKSRSWEEDAYALRSEINSLMERFKNKVISSNDVYNALYPSPLESRAIIPSTTPQVRTLGDRVLDLQSIITHDNVLSIDERRTENAKNTSLWYLALNACRTNSAQLFFDGIADIKKAFLSGKIPKNPIVINAFKEAHYLSRQVIPTNSLDHADIDNDNIWPTSQQIQKARTIKIPLTQKHNDPLQ